MTLHIYLKLTYEHAFPFSTQILFYIAFDEINK